MTATRHEKIAGILLGAAVGDALGWPQEDRSRILGGKSARIVEPRPEFRTWLRHGGTQFARYLDPVAAGEYSDDTQLLLAVAHSCTRGEEWFEWFTRTELPQWCAYQRGGGGAVLRAAHAWADGSTPWACTLKKEFVRAEKYFAAGANGVAMRIAPHVAVTATKSVEELLHRVALDGLSTHGHPRAIIGACIHALTLRHALLQEGTLEYGALLEAVLREDAWRSSGVLFNATMPDWFEAHRKVSRGSGSTDLEGLWNRTVDETLQKLVIARDSLARGALANDQQTLGELGCFGNESGSGTVTAVAALYVASRTATQPISGLLRTAFLENADTDTLCSMTGSILGAVHGTRWLNTLANDVQDQEHLRHTAHRLAGQELADDTLPTLITVEPRTAGPGIQKVKEWTTALLEDPSAGSVPDGRAFKVLDIQELATKTKNYAVRIVGRTGDGQTLFIDQITKAQNEAVRRARPAAPLPLEDVPSHMSTADRRPARPPVEPELASVEIKVDDLDVAHRFYADILNVPCHMTGDKLLVGKGLVLSAETPNGIRSHRGVIINLTVEDLRVMAARIESRPEIEFAWAQEGESLWLKDPSDNRVRITRSARSR